jgi:hypothetical protein
MASEGAVTVQDDARENELRGLFQLEKPSDEGRSGVDAVLSLDGKRYLFELKSTTTGSVTTVRDFGMEHIEKWKGKHWLIGVYSKAQLLQHTFYLTPDDMWPGIKEKEKYVHLDYEVAKYAPNLIGLDALYSLLGKKEKYSYKEAVEVHKRQYTKAQYLEKMDVPNGYSKDRMLDILRDRCRYLIERGSTLNNPHVPAAYIAERGNKILSEHSSKLRGLVRAFASSHK